MREPTDISTAAVSGSAGQADAEEAAWMRVTADRLDAETRRAAAAFLAQASECCGPLVAILYGSRARGTHSPDSDADIVVVLEDRGQDRFLLLQTLSDAAYDVLMETGVYIQPLLIWESEWQRPELFSNPGLIETIKREGVRL